MSKTVGFSILKNEDEKYEYFLLSSEGGNACVKKEAVEVFKINDRELREELDKYLKEGETDNIIGNKKPEIISDISEKINEINNFYNDKIKNSLTNINTVISDKDKKKEFDTKLKEYNILIKELKQIIKNNKNIIDKTNNNELENLKKNINTINTNIKDKGLQKIEDLEDNKKNFWDKIIGKGGKQTRRHKISQNHKRTVRKNK
jgi:hypothetical protein